MIKATKNIRTEKISFTDHNLLKNLCGEHDKHLKLIEKLEPVKVKAWGNHLSISGDERQCPENFSVCSSSFIPSWKKDGIFMSSDIDYAHRILSEDITF